MANVIVTELNQVLLKGKNDDLGLTCTPDAGEVNRHYTNLIRALHLTGYRVIIITTRKEEERVDFEVWLEENFIPYDQLIMAGSHDRGASASTFKTQAITNSLRTGDTLDYIIEPAAGCVTRLHREFPNACIITPVTGGVL